MTADRDNIQDWIIYPMKHLIPPESNFSIIFQQMASRLTAAAVALLLCAVSFDNQVHGIAATFTKTVLGKQGESITQNFSSLTKRGNSNSDQTGCCNKLPWSEGCMYNRTV